MHIKASRVLLDIARKIFAQRPLAPSWLDNAPQTQSLSMLSCSSIYHIGDISDAGILIPGLQFDMNLFILSVVEKPS